MRLILLPVLLLIGGCVSIPVPPFGQNRGDLGELQVKVAVSYVPKSSPEREPDRSMQYAWKQFGLTQPKLLKDK